MTAEAPDRPWTRVGSYAICLDDAGRLLLVRLASDDPDGGRWTLPGGGIEWAEHPAAAVLRELEEETGLSGEIETVAGVFSTVYERTDERPRDSLHVVGVVYRVRITGGTVREKTNESSDRAAWVARGEVADLPLVELAQYAVPLAWGA